MQSLPSTLLDMAKESFVSTRRGGEITSWNLGASALYGWQPHEAIGHRISDLLGPYSRDVERSVASKGVWEGTLIRTKRDGTEVQTRVRLARFDHPSSTSEWMEVSSPVETEHPAERALAESEYRYRNLFGAVAASFWELDFSGVSEILRDLMRNGITDLPGHLRTNPEASRAMMKATRIIDVNDRSVELFGPGTKRDLIATPLDRYWPTESTLDFAESVISAISGKARHIAETRVCAIDGRCFDAVFTVSFLPGTVGNGALLVGFTDISDRARVMRELGEASVRQKMLFDVPTIALCEMASPEIRTAFQRLRNEGVDDLRPYIERHPQFLDFAMSELRFENVNDAAVRLFRARSREDLIGRSLTGIMLPRSEVFRRSLEGSFVREMVYQAELRVVALDGAPVDTLFCRVTNSDHVRDQVLVAQIDISEQIKGREEIERMRQQVAHASRISLLGQLSASIVHEISQPITAISNHAAAADRLARRPGPNPQSLLDVTSRIGQHATRVAEIIQRIREMAADKDICRVPVSVSEIVMETRKLLRQELTDNRVTVCQTRTGGADIVLGDRIQLQQILANLIINAIQAMEAGPDDDRWLEIALKATASTIRVEVIDTGPGLTEELLAAPFRNFQSTKPDGLGIGLTICRSIAEAHGGVIEAGNRTDRSGAVLTLVLPAFRQKQE